MKLDDIRQRCEYYGRALENRKDDKFFYEEKSTEDLITYYRRQIKNNSYADITYLLSLVDELIAENERLRELIDTKCDDCACGILNERDALIAKLERVTRERDAAIAE